VVDGAEGPGSFDELDKLVVAPLQSLQMVGANKNGAEDEGRAGRVKVEDWSCRRGDGGGRGGGEIVGGSCGNQWKKGRTKKGGTVTRCSGGETEGGEGDIQTGTGRKRCEGERWEELRGRVGCT
jgi:hypothetical protein